MPLRLKSSIFDASSTKVRRPGVDLLSSLLYVPAEWRPFSIQRTITCLFNHGFFRSLVFAFPELSASAYRSAGKTNARAHKRGNEDVFKAGCMGDPLLKDTGLDRLPRTSAATNPVHLIKGEAF